MASVIDFKKAKEKLSQKREQEEELTPEFEDFFEAVQQQNRLTEQRLKRERKFLNDRLKRELGMGQTN